MADSETRLTIADPIPLIEVSAPPSTRVTRRGVLRFAFFGSMLTMLGGVGVTLVNTVYPRGVKGFGGPVIVLAADIPHSGDPPKQNFEGHFLLVNLLPDEGRLASDKLPSPGGLLALWWKCPHLGCTVPWKENFVAEDDPLQRRGNFNCNCHSSTYTKSGTLVRGPATRSMDTMEIEIVKDGIIVNSGKIRRGADDNARRGIPYPAAQS